MKTVVGYGLFSVVRPGSLCGDGLSAATNGGVWGGAFAAAFVPPVCELLPFVMWAKAGLMELLWYVAIWAVGIMGLMIAKD